MLCLPYTWYKLLHVCIAFFVICYNFFFYAEIVDCSYKLQILCKNKLFSDGLFLGWLAGPHSYSINTSPSGLHKWRQQRAFRFLSGSEGIKFSFV
jgi:hypothetical protein